MRRFRQAHNLKARIAEHEAGTEYLLNLRQAKALAALGHALATSWREEDATALEALLSATKGVGLVIDRDTMERISRAVATSMNVQSMLNARRDAWSTIEAAADRIEQAAEQARADYARATVVMAFDFIAGQPGSSTQTMSS